MYEEWNSSNWKGGKAPGKIRVVDLKYPRKEAVKYFSL